MALILGLDVMRGVRAGDESSHDQTFMLES